MSALALEIDQVMRQMDSVTASRFERLVRDALALVQPTTSKGASRRADLRFPLAQGARVITSEDVAGLEDEA